MNVKPLLIALIILLGFEFLVLISIIYLRYKRKTEGDDQEQSDLPELPMSALIPFAPVLTRVYPENGIPLAILLIVDIFGLDLKSVSEKELQKIDGVGPTLSKKIRQFADSY